VSGSNESYKTKYKLHITDRQVENSFPARAYLIHTVLRENFVRTGDTSIRCNIEPNGPLIE
jgi:hypothetical protein